MKAWQFTTDAYLKPERRAAWREAMERLRLPVGDLPAEGAFHAQVSSLTSPMGVEFAVVASTPQEISGRNPDQPAAVWLAVLLEGEAILSDGVREMPVAAGDIVYGPTGQTAGLRLTTRFKLLFITAPRLALDHRLLAPSALRIGHLAAGEGVNHVFSGLLRATAQALDELSSDQLRPVELALTEFLRQQKVVSAYLEFFGEGARDLTIGDRATISNMTPEFGASAGLFYIDEQTLDYLTLTGREPEQVKLVEQYAKTAGLWADDLEGAEYERVLEFDLSSVARNMAGPSNPHRRLPTTALHERGIAVGLEKAREEEAQGKLPDGAVIIAAITSCTNTSNPRNVVAAGLLAKKANALGLLRKPWVKTSFAPGSKVARLYLEEAGLLPELEKLGFGIVAYACTTCNGMSGALDPAIQQEIIARDLYATAVLSGNRNFDGRIHPYAKQAFLASPPLVVAYAIAGTVRFDIEKDVLGFDDNGMPITLKTLWPSDEEIDAIVRDHVHPEQFRQVYIPMFDLDRGARAPSPLYDWRPQSTYIRRPPYWEGALAGERSLTGMRPLAVLGDNITTDHLSPSNAILASSAAGEYLAKMGLPEEDFNSYATHRGDHLTAQRATFANPKLLNEMCLDGKTGEPIQGSLARLEPEGDIVRMWEAIETYMARKQPLIIVAGADYGQGSSRDWAAKGVRLAGVEAIVAEGFERIHRTNLVGMGVLPLEFKAGENRNTFGIDGSELYDVVGDIAPRAELTLIIHRQNGDSVQVPVTCRLDTAEEVSVYEAGGVLQRFAQDFLAGNEAA